MRTLVSILLVLGCLSASPARVSAEEVLRPNKAYGAFLKKSRSMSDAEKKQYALEYLERWEGTGKEASGADRYAQAQFQQLADQFEKALEGFRATRQNEKLKDRTRDYGATAEAALLLLPEVRTALGAEGVDKAADALEAYAPAMLSDPSRGKSRSKLLTVLARLHGDAGRHDAAHAMRMKIIAEDPKQISSLVLPIVRNLLASAHTMAGYEAARAKARKALEIMAKHQADALDQARKKHTMMLAKLRAEEPDALDSAGALKKTDRGEMSAGERAVWSSQRSLDGAEELMALIRRADKPFELLGKAAAAWTLEHAFGGVSDLASLKGKVVVLDFWISWPDQCNFPVMRDLQKAFVEKDLVIVGVTATATVCYEQRYDMDADLRAKSRGQKFYAARLASDEAPANPDQAILEEAAYRTRELEALGNFIKNHELAWPHVMIEKAEPAAKYGMEGWPGFVVIDKQGRLRYLRSGEISRSDEADVASLRKVVEDLLAE